MSVGALTIMVRAFSVLKEIRVASTYGVGESLDAFLLAYLAPSFAVSIIAGSFYSAFVPALIKVRERDGAAAAKQLFSEVAFVAVVILLAVTALLGASSKWLIAALASGFSPPKVALTIALFNQMLPLILISGLCLLGAAALNGHKKFALIAIAPVTTPITITVILTVYPAAAQSPERLVLGTLAGAICELSIVLWGLKKVHFLAVPTWRGMNANLKQFFSQYLPLIGGTVMMGGTTVTDQVMTTWLAPGSVSALSYATKVPALLTGLAGATLGAVVLPYLAQQIADKNHIGLRHTLYTYSKLIGIFSVPLVVIGIVFSQLIIGILFERGAFARVDTILVSEIMQFSLLQVPFYVLGTLLARYISALSGNRFLLYCAVASLLLNVVLNYVLMKFMGVAGVALSTSLVYLLTDVALYFVVRKLLAGHFNVNG